MNNEQFVFAPYSDAEQEKHPKDFKEIFYKYAYHWPLFLVCLLVTLTIASFYLKVAKPVYHVKAKLSIKDEKKSTAEKLALEELNIATTPKVIESEVEVLKSRPVVKSVVDKLQLWTTYSEPAKYSDNDLYTGTPVRFRLLKQTGRIPDRSFKVIIKSATQFTLEEDDKEPVSATFANTLTNNFGVWKLEPTSTILDYIGKTVFIDIHDPDKVISDYQKAITVVLNRNAPVVELNIDDEVPERGKEVLNRLISAYKTSNVLDKNKETDNTLKFIDDRLASLTGELTDVEKNVEGYKSSIGLTDISSKSQFFLDNVQSNDSKLNEVNVQLNVIEGIERYVNTAGNSENAPATLGITDPGLISLVEQLTKLQLQRDKLLAITPEENPLFVPLNRQIKSIKTAIKENISGIKSSLLATKRQLDKINNQFESSIKNIPGQERQYVSIKRQQGVKEGLYVYLLQQREQIALSYASTLTDAKVIEEAYYEEPQTKKGLPVGVALMLGLIIPAGLIYSREVLRNRVQSRKDIEAATAAPIICELIQGENNSPIVVLNREAYAIGEQLRALRTNLLQAFDSKGQGRVTLFTSSIPGEGKSFVASNIAASLAASGRKTVILELDLRKPKITEIFNLDNTKPGLSNLLNGEVSKDEIIERSDLHPNLYVMRSGPIPTNPSELLEAGGIAPLIEELRYEFDNVLIDSPPLRLVTDAMVLAPLCDLCLYMVRHNFTPKSELEFIDQIYRKNKMPNLNLIFNGVHMDSRYGYSVDYGYYSEKPKNRSLWYALFGKFSTRF